MGIKLDLINNYNNHWDDLKSKPRSNNWVSICTFHHSNAVRSITSKMLFGLTSQGRHCNSKIGMDTRPSPSDKHPCLASATVWADFCPVNLNHLRMVFANGPCNNATMKEQTLGFEVVKAWVMGKKLDTDGTSRKQPRWWLAFQWSNEVDCLIVKPDGSVSKVNV